ncbi:MAG: hypothetical protein H7227_00240 [Actinobacteria bacterium]|nr:hypothetical protein [Actinomycetota bacterium]
MGDASAPTQGASADFLILDRNPLEDIGSLKNSADRYTKAYAGRANSFGKDEE